MPLTKTYFWQKVPTLRLLVPLAVGIAWQWYLPLHSLFILGVLLSAIAFLFVCLLLRVVHYFRLIGINGFTVNLLLFAMGAGLVWANDVRNKEHWIGYRQSSNSHTQVRLLEEPIEKQNSFKATADVTFVYERGKRLNALGKVILYFKKDSSTNSLHIGSELIFRKALLEIKNSGNPESFDYKRYCLFGGITHWISLGKKDFKMIGQSQPGLIKSTILKTQTEILSILKTYIKAPKEQGLAEALLIGYKPDLDRDLVQAYSNTGVVHVIAISGLHIGLIYGLLLWITRPFQKRKSLQLFRFAILLIGLWGFGLIAGAQPSVMRSVVMFSVLAIGQLMGKNASPYNLLACSAFLLLCWNPFWLWDVGFQLSYTAVLSIMVFYKPIYNWIYVRNKCLDKVWEMIAGTLAAQLLTLPVIIYHFHQFPLLFLVANLVAIPLSCLILYAELALLVAALVPAAALVIGIGTEKMIRLLNNYVEALNQLPFATWNGLSIIIVQLFLLFGIAAGIGYWLLEKHKPALWLALFCLLAFSFFRLISIIEAHNQKQLIVYNVPKLQAIDIVDGQQYHFIGDKALTTDGSLRNFHLQPSRIQLRTESVEQPMPKSFNFYGKKVWIIDTTLSIKPISGKPIIDLLILSHNPKLYLKDLLSVVHVKQVVVDGSVPFKKKNYWRKDCDSLRVAYHDVAEKGAFVMKLQ